MSCTGSEDDGGGDRAALVDRGLLAPRIPRPPSGTSYHSPITFLSDRITHHHQVRLSLS